MTIATYVERVLESAKLDGLAADRRAGPSLLRRDVWRDAAIMWAIQFALISAITYVGRVLTLDTNGVSTHLTWQGMFHSWLVWDAANYAIIARVGYYQLWLTRYFPLFPLLEHVVAPLTGGNPAIAGLLISNLATFGAFVLLRGLVEREWGADVARRTIFYLAVFPTSFFFTMAYAESLYVLLCVGTFLCLRRGNWLLAGALAGLGALTRPVGFVLFVPIAIEAVSRLRAGGHLVHFRQRVAMLGGALLPIAAAAGFSLYLAHLFGSMTTLLQSSGADGAAGSGKNFTWPWVGFARAGNALLQHGFSPSFFQVHIVLDATFTLALIVLAIATIRWLPLPYAGYTLAVTLMLLCLPGHNWYALYSNMRFMLEVFPVFIVLATWGERRNFERGFLLVSLPLLALFTLTFILGNWVA